MSGQTTLKRARGRPGTYANAAERAKAWRERQKALIAQANVPISVPEPVIIEKIVEKPVYLSGPKPSRGSKNVALASKLVPLIKQRLTGYGAEKQAKTLRVNAARVATMARELLDLLAFDWRGAGIETAEKEFLENVERFFLSLNSTFENSQHDAKVTSARLARESEQRHEQRLKELAVKTLGKDPSLNVALLLAEDLLMFHENADAWLVKQFGVDRGHFFINRSYEIKNAIRTNDLKALMRELAEVREEVGERGRRFEYQDEQCFTAGWAEFEKWRTERSAAIG